VSAVKKAARALESAHLAVADAAAQFVDGEASIVDLRKAVSDWRKAGEAFHATMCAAASLPSNGPIVDLREQQQHMPIPNTGNRRFATIEAQHVGRMLFEAFGRKWRVSDFIGRITKRDIGKRVYLVGDMRALGAFVQVENDEQLAARTNKPAPCDCSCLPCICK
jgi:hypothetical protein